jgi:hypothetical protein
MVSFDVQLLQWVGEMTCFKMLCEHCGIGLICSKRTCHDQDGVLFGNCLEFIEDYSSEPLTELFVLEPSARMNRFRRIDYEMVVDKSGLDIRKPRL